MEAAAIEEYAHLKGFAAAPRTVLFCTMSEGRFGFEKVSSMVDICVTCTQIRLIPAPRYPRSPLPAPRSPLPGERAAEDALRRAGTRRFLFPAGPGLTPPPPLA